MKKIIQVCSFLTFALAFSIVTVQAQSVKKLEAEIPFDFHVGDKVYEAGTYEMKIIGNSSGDVSVDITSKDGKMTRKVFARRNGDSRNGKSELIFDRVGDQRFLTSILAGGTGFTVQVSSPAKKQIAAKHQGQATTSSSVND